MPSITNNIHVSDKLSVIGGSDDGAAIVEYRFTRKTAESIARGDLSPDSLPVAVWQTIMGQWLEGYTARENPVG